MKEEVRSTKDQAWRALWRNVRHHRRPLMTQAQRICTLLRAVRPILDFRMSRWPAAPGLTTFIDKLHRQFATQCMDLRPEPHESVSEFVRRRGHLAGGLCRSHGLFSSRLKDRVSKWDAHVRRAPSHPAAKLLSFHGDEWLSERRIELLPFNTLSSWTSTAGRTGTRCLPGLVVRRWNQAVQHARGLD